MTRITITIYCEDVSPDPVFVQLEVPASTTMSELKAMVFQEASIPAHQNRPSCFFKDNNAIKDSETLGRLAIPENDIMVLIVGGPRDPSASLSENRTETAEDIERHRTRLLTDGVAVAQLSVHQPTLFNAIRDPDEFRRVWKSLEKGEEEQEQMRSLYAQLLNSDPLNPDTQDKIAEIIRQERVLENLQYAYEHSPEVFTRVSMLYIQTYVNGHSVKAFVDSGAQATIMSPACAERCGIMRLIDKRYSGVAKGVGTANILGRVHSAEMKVGDAIMTCAFTVMEGRDVELLFGLDMLKRHRACIDLRNNKLILETTEVPFLPESEIPKMFEEIPTQPMPSRLQGSSSLLTPAGPSGGRPVGVTGNSQLQPPQPQQFTQPGHRAHPPSAVQQGLGNNVGNFPTQPPLVSAQGLNAQSYASQPRNVTHSQIHQLAQTRAQELGITPEELLRRLAAIAGGSSLAVGPNGQIMRIGPSGRLVPGPPNLQPRALAAARAAPNGAGSALDPLRPFSPLSASRVGGGGAGSGVVSEGGGGSVPNGGGANGPSATSASESVPSRPESSALAAADGPPTPSGRPAAPGSGSDFPSRSGSSPSTDPASSQGGGGSGVGGPGFGLRPPAPYVTTQADIQSLVEMGIQPSLAELALQQTGGNIDAAAMLAFEWTS